MTNLNIGVNLAIAGMLAFFGAVLVETGLESFLEDGGVIMLSSFALLEEVCKMLPIFLFRKRIAEDNLAKYAVLIAWIFAMVENAGFRLEAVEQRLLLATNLHVIATLIAVMIWKKYRGWRGVVAGITVATLIHWAFNFVVINLL